MTEFQVESVFARGEEMALNQIDKKWIETTIRESISAHYGTKLARMRDWLPAGAVVAIALFTLLQWNAYTVFRTHMEDRLATIESNLLTLRAAQSPLKVLQEISALQPPQFSN